MSLRYIGAKLSAIVATSSTTAAVGLWTMRQQFKAIGNYAWPTSNGQQAYTTPGTYSWVCPDNVFFVSVVAVGGGAGGCFQTDNRAQAGGGGGLGWKNNIAVVPGTSYTLVVGAGGPYDVSGGNSYFISTSTVAGFGATAGNNLTVSIGGSYTGDGGGSGGNGGGSGAGGGGAGGYAGNGGNGSTAGSNAGSGGGGGGGSGVFPTFYVAVTGGGGVGILGQGANGAGGIPGDGFTGGYPTGGGGGSGGVSAPNATGSNDATPGGAYGGGGSGQYFAENGSAGAGGAVRIIWGQNRAFPSTNTGDL